MLLICMKLMQSNTLEYKWIAWDRESPWALKHKVVLQGRHYACSSMYANIYQHAPLGGTWHQYLMELLSFVLRIYNMNDKQPYGWRGRISCPKVFCRQTIVWRDMVACRTTITWLITPVANCNFCIEAKQ